MNPTEQKILDLIRETLPEKEVGIVRDIFNENAQLKKNNEYLDALVKDMQEKLENAQKYITELEDNSVTVRQNAAKNAEDRAIIDQKTKELAEAEMKLKVDIAQAELRAYREAMQMVFKVPQVRKEFYKSVPIETNGYINNASENGSETTTEE